MKTLQTRLDRLEARHAGPTGYSYAAQDVVTGLWSVGPHGPDGLTGADVDRLGIVKRYIGFSPDDWDKVTP